MVQKGGNKNKQKSKSPRVREKIHLKSEINFQVALLILIICFVFASVFIFYVRQKILKEMVWEPITLSRPKSYEQVLLSMINGTIKSLNEKTFVVEADGKKIQFYINANTRLFNGAGEKLSDESGFSFSDYLKDGQKVKVLYAPYDNVLLASEIWLMF